MHTNLPFAFDHLESHVVQYPQNNPPVVPQIEICPEADTILIYACSAVANEAGAVAMSSPARAFCFNMLSSNNWMNAQFAEVVKLSLDICVIKVRSGMGVNAAAFLGDAVVEALALYTSMLVVSYPDLARVSTPEQLSSASNNHRVYVDLMEDCKTLYRQNLPYAQPIHPSQRFQGSPRVVQQAMPAAAHPAARAGYSGRQQVVDEPPVVQKRALPKPISAAAVAQSQRAAPPAPAPDPNSIPTILVDTTFRRLIGDIENMDRKAHSIPYAGREMPVQTAPLRRKMEEAVEAMEESASERNDIPGVQVNPVILPALYFDELISSAHANWMSTVDPANLSVHLRQGWVLTPVAGSFPLRGLFEELSKTATFAALASAVNAYVDSIEDKAVLRATLIVVSQIDRIMTKVLNEYLAQHTDPRACLKSSSFLEDAGTIVKYLNERFMGKVNQSYNDYQQRVMCKLFGNIRGTADDLDGYRDSYDCENGEFMTQAYTMIYINATTPELGYKVTDEPKEVTKKMTPLLYRLLCAAFEYDDKRDIAPNHVIVLADCTKYSVALSNYNEDGSPIFLIREI